MVIACLFWRSKTKNTSICLLFFRKFLTKVKGDNIDYSVFWYAWATHWARKRLTDTGPERQYLKRRMSYGADMQT